MTYETEGQYGARIRNNAARMIDSVTQDLGPGKPGLHTEIMAAVLIAQSNLAIAASIVEAATINAQGGRS